MVGYITLYDRRMEFRCDKEMELYLRELNIGERSLYIRDLINKDRLDRLDPKIIDNKIREHEAEIKQLKALKGTKKVNENKIQELLNYHAPNYKQNAMVRTEGQRIRFIKQAIMPQLKKAGSTATAEEIDDILINWPEG